VIGCGVEVGCDIEWRDPDLACPAVADRLFSPDERTALASLSGTAWVEGFFNCWTRKEAYVKALGLGLSYPLHAFSVSVAPGEPARLIDANPGWSLSSFEPASGYQAALVTGAAA
jgi:4'-phosphopantetheinyl transferase